MSFSSGVMDDLGDDDARVGAVGAAGRWFGMGVAAGPGAGGDAPPLDAPGFALVELASSVVLPPTLEAMMTFNSGSVKSDSSSTVMRTLPEVRSSRFSMRVWEVISSFFISAMA